MLTTLRWLVFAVAALLMNAPVLITAVTSFKGPREVSSNPSLWIEAPTLANYREVLQVTDRLDIYSYLFNSLAAASIGTLLAIALALPAAYAIGREKIGRQALLPLVVNLRAVPLIIFAIPLYVMFQWAGLLDTRLGLGLILTIVNLPLALVILVNGVREVPVELDEAAFVDGGRPIQILFRIITPLCRPALITTFIFGFITAWNEFLFGLLLTTEAAVPMTVGASFFFATSAGGVKWGVAAAIMIIGALPPTLLGLLMYRGLTGSMTAGALRG
ncbi:MAG: carbohydrate ABC transporter permease [Pseudomonadota bacterium]